MGGEPHPARAFEPYIPFGISLLPEPRDLSAEGFLVALAQHQPVMVENVSAQVVARPHGAHVPAPVYLQVVVAGEYEDGELDHQVQERLVAVLDYYVVGEAAVMPQPLADVALELAVEIVHAF